MQGQTLITPGADVRGIIFTTVRCLASKLATKFVECFTISQGHIHLIVGLKTIAINHMVNLKLVSHLPMGHPSLLKDDHSFIHSFLQGSHMINLIS